jgi:chromosomal replication initiation ATPase DnaA
METQQITFPLAADKKSNHPDEFIESTSNTVAYNIIKNWPASWGVEPYPRSLLISGPASSGKTCLANIWAKKSGALLIKKSHLLTENIINHHDGFIIENINDGWDPKLLLHHFNIINEHKKYLLLTKSGDVTFDLPDLVSRLKSVNNIAITQPDDELVKILIFKLFSGYSVVVGAEVINYMLKVIPREFGKITHYTSLINDLALKTKRKISIPLVKEVLV